MGLLVSGTLIFLVPLVWVAGRVRGELEQHERIRVPTFAALFVAYGGHGAVTLLAAWNSTWTLPVAGRWAVPVGAGMAAAGAALYLAGRIELGSFKRTWGLEGGRLITTRIYRYSRNPQTAGAILLLAGAGVAGRSWVALLLTGVLVLATAVWLPIEERVLEKQFGEQYRRYRHETARFLGVPGSRGPTAGPATR